MSSFVYNLGLYLSHWQTSCGCIGDQCRFLKVFFCFSVNLYILKVAGLKYSITTSNAPVICIHAPTYRDSWAKNALQLIFNCPLSAGEV